MFELNKKKEVHPRKPSRVEAELLKCPVIENESWRVLRILSEFVQGFDVLSRYGLSATFFGSARVMPDNPYYAAARELSSKLACQGFALITGGAAGIMEAGNRGAYEAGGKSLGINIDLPHEQKVNKYTTEDITMHYFFSRKVMLTYASEVYVYFPGGFGTLDELLEIVTLIQTKKVARIPIILYGKAYWEPFLAFVEDTLLKDAYIDTEDVHIFTLVDSVDEAYAAILKKTNHKEI